MSNYVQPHSFSGATLSPRLAPFIAGRCRGCGDTWTAAENQQVGIEST